MSTNSESRDDTEDLPDGWRIGISKSKPGQKFYFNPKNGQSVWASSKITNKNLIEKEKQHNKNLRNLEKMEKGAKRKSDGVAANNVKVPKIDYNVQKSPINIIANNTPTMSNNVASENKLTTSRIHCNVAPKNLASKRLSALRAKIHAEAEETKKVEATILNSDATKPHQTLTNISYPTNSTGNKNTTKKISKANIKKSLNKVLNNIAKPQGVQKSKTNEIKQKKRKRKKNTIPIELPEKTVLNNTLTSIKSNLDETVNKLYSETAVTPKNEININSRINTEPKVLKLNPSPGILNAESRIIKTEPRNIRSQHYTKQNTIPRELKFKEIKPNILNLEPRNSNITSALNSTPKTPIVNETVCFNTSNFKNTPKSSEVKIYSSAKDRLSAFRSRISETTNDNSSVEDMVISGSIANDNVINVNDSMTNNNYSGININDTTANVMEEDRSMEVDDPVEPTPVSVTTNKTELSENKLVLVVDTNLFIHDLNGLKNVLNSTIKGYKELPTLMVPWRVLNELDALKDNNRNDGEVSKKARHAMDYLYQSLPANNRIKGQTLRDAHNHIYPCEIADDEILNCCFQQANLGNSVVLMSNDKNLCTKARVNGIQSSSITALSSEVDVKQEIPAQLDDKFGLLQSYLYDLLANIMENEMRVKFDNLWQHLLFKVPPWTLKDVVCSILKNWYAVFSEVFPIKKMESDMKNLKSLLTMIECKGSQNIRQNEFDKFKELAIEIATTCQIIPEYMNLAKVTLDKLNGNERCDIVNEDVGNCKTDVIGAFEKLWTVFSSYCARLSEYLGISHDLDIKINPEESCTGLEDKKNIYNNLITQFTLSLKDMLGIQLNDPKSSQLVANLENVFNTSLAAVNCDCRLNNINLLDFCSNNRNMLLEAYTKFLQLSNLILQCDKQAISPT